MQVKLLHIISQSFSSSVIFETENVRTPINSTPRIFFKLKKIFLRVTLHVFESKKLFLDVLDIKF